MAKVIPQKVSEAKVSYVFLYPFDRATTDKEGLHSPFQSVSDREEREKVAEVLLDLME